MVSMKVTSVKRSVLGGQRPRGKPALGAAPVAFQLVDNEDCTFVVYGVDAGGNQVDISAVAKLTAASDAPAVLTVDTPTGMASAMHAVGPVGTANITLVATWNDGSVGPYTITWPITVSAGGPTGIEVVPGTPTVH